MRGEFDGRRGLRTKAAPAKTIPRTTNVPINGAMLAAIVPVVPYGLSKTTQDAIRAPMAAANTTKLTTCGELSRPHYLQFGRDAGAFYREKKWLDAMDYTPSVPPILSSRLQERFPQGTEANGRKVSLPAPVIVSWKQAEDGAFFPGKRLCYK